MFGDCLLLLKMRVEEDVQAILVIFLSEKKGPKIISSPHAGVMLYIRKENGGRSKLGKFVWFWILVVSTSNNSY